MFKHGDEAFDVLRVVEEMRGDANPLWLLRHGDVALRETRDDARGLLHLDERLA